MDDWVSLTAADLMVSLRIPRGWEVRSTSVHDVLVQGPGEGTEPAPTLTVRDGEPEEPGHDWFVGFAAAVPGALAEQVEGFELIDVERYRLSSFHADALVVRARRSGGAAPPTAQLQAHVWVRDDTMYVIGGSTPVEHEARDLPIFAAMVRSLRVLPPRLGER